MAEPDSLVPLTEGRELFIGLVAPLGVDLDDAMEVLKASFKGVGYETHEIRMSALLREVPSVAKSLPDPSATEDARIEGYMDAADKLRSDVGTGSVLVHLAMANMRDWRTQKTGSVRPVPHTAVVFNSLKHPDEIRALRKIYGDAFFAISIFTPTKSRIEALSRRIAKSRQSSPDEWLDVAERLVKKDAEAPSVRLGQNVEGTFPLGDFFVRGEHSSIRSEIGRLTDVLFSDPFRTPTVDECGMPRRQRCAPQTFRAKSELSSATVKEPCLPRDATRSQNLVGDFIGKATAPTEGTSRSAPIPMRSRESRSLGKCSRR